MKTIGVHNYYVYILTNKSRTVLYTGFTNDIFNRLYWHRNPDCLIRHHFTYRYKCFYLLYYEHFQEADLAIAREKQIKGYSRIKKEKLINEFNPHWEFLNDRIAN